MSPMVMRFDATVRRRLVILAAVLLASLSVFPSHGHAASPEQRCTDLGANCVCSEPLEATAYNLIGSSSFAWNANDSTTKECASSNTPGAVVLRGGSDFGPSSDPTILGKFPAGHSVPRVLKGAEGHTGQFDLGHWFADNTPTARRAVRWYVYFSPNFQFSIEGGGCLNSGKAFRFTDQGPAMSFNGNWLIYSWTFWSVAGYDCCINGPGQDAAFNALTPAQFKGKWWRMEAIERNLGGTPTILQVYWKDMSTGIEYKVIDTSIPTNQPGGSNWTTAQATSLSHPPTGDGVPGAMSIEWFRNGTCAGYFAASHILYAAWSTDAGQRIGAATEIEGGGGTPPPPTVPPSPPGTPTMR